MEELTQAEIEALIMTVIVIALLLFVIFATSEEGEVERNNIPVFGEQVRP